MQTTFVFAFAQIINSYPYAFTTIGDWGFRINYAAKIAATSSRAKSRFTCAIGDNFYLNGVRSTNDPKWKTIFERIYTQKFFQKKWYVIAGNHDYAGSMKAQIDYSKKSKRWTFPSLYYKQTFTLRKGQTLDLIMIDTTPLYEFKKRDNKQLAWIKATLKASTAKWIIVMGHHQIYSLTSNSAYLMSHLKPLLVKYKVAAYVNGHHHSQQHHSDKKLHYLVIGNTAAAKPPGRLNVGVRGVKTHFLFCSRAQYAKFGRGGCMGYGIFRINSPKKMAVDFYNRNGKRMYTAKITNPR